ncbi:hypothetical protein AYO20_00799 [Fonsecaea nubica]|uniref:Pru domain-containing protein n=1 Tax=Fonsecaea nubica TaxID=856822 RepID=A0A178DDY4_9EURO|nr:hypothetical protein AYO20_00799 [Fonsecaea nubica]OAL39887.1 hypothetical protein AYO20_00799 [Fonsecaea nubica]
MSISPILTFKAGLCELDTSTSPPRAKPLPTPGYLYLYADELLHLCWRPRTAPLDQPQLDLLMVPMDGSFTPYQPTSAENPSNSKTPTNGRIYVLKFTSSSQRHLFWLQSRSQHPQGDPSWFSARDLKLGQIVNNLLQGEDVDVQEQMASLPPDGNSPDDDGAEPMEDVEGTDHNPNRRPSQGPGAGPDATGGDFREEGEESREGGADGGRAAAAEGLDASALVRNFLQSMEQRPQHQAPQEKLFTSLGDLLTGSSTLPLIESADDKLLDRLFECLPTHLSEMVRASVDTSSLQDPNSAPEQRDAVKRQLTNCKKALLRRVLHTPQFTQSLSSLTIALREGGLPIVSETFKIPVRNGGYLRHGGVPMGGGEAVEAFIAGVKKDVEDKLAKGDEDGAGDRMDQD